MINFKKLVFVFAGILLIVALIAVGCSKPARVDTSKPTGDEAKSAEVIELKYSCLYTPPTPYATSAETWIEWIHEKTEGRVKITPFWGGTLVGGKEAKAELVAGAVDIAHCTLYSDLGYEITFNLPKFLYKSPNPEVSARVSLEILEKFPEFQQEFSDVIILGYTNAQDYYLMSKKPIRMLEDLKGMQISAGEEAQELFTDLGASAIKMPPSDQYIALEKGTIDATFLPIEVLKSFGFAEVAKYTNLDMRMATGAKPTQFMNKKSFEKLPPDIQQIFLDSRKIWLEAMLKDFDAAAQAGIDYGTEMKNEFFRFSEEEKEKWQNLQGICALKAAQELDAIGKPGTEIMNEANRLIKE